MRRFAMSFAIVLGLVTASMAQADSLPIFHNSGWEDFGGFNYRFNDAAGTAWVDLFLRTERPVSCPPGHGPGIPVSCGSRYSTRTVSASVAGLSFDALAAQIVFNSSTGKVVCATVTEKHGLFGRKWMIAPTGDCRIRVRNEGRGFTAFFESK